MSQRESGGLILLPDPQASKLTGMQVGTPLSSPWASQNPSPLPALRPASHGWQSKLELRAPPGRWGLGGRGAGAASLDRRALADHSTWGGGGEAACPRPKDASGIEDQSLAAHLPTPRLGLRRVKSRQSPRGPLLATLHGRLAPESRGSRGSQSAVYFQQEGGVQWGSGYRFGKMGSQRLAGGQGGPQIGVQSRGQQSGAVGLSLSRQRERLDHPKGIGVQRPANPNSFPSRQAGGRTHIRAGRSSGSAGGAPAPCLARPLYPAGRPKPHSCAAPWERAHTLAGLGFPVPWSQVRPPRPGTSGRERAAGAGSAQVSLGPTGATNARCHTPRGTPALPAPLSLQLPLEGGPCSLRP